MDRRALIAGALALGLLAVPLAAEAQRVGRVYRIGVLETTSRALNAASFEAFLGGLRELGYVEGQNLVIEYRSADGQVTRFPDLAVELVGLNVDLILTRRTPAALEARNATPAIPIVMAASGDPLAAGVVAILAHPGRNVTGLSAVSPERMGKQLGLLTEMVPRIARIAILLNLSNPTLQL
jgi:putative ABC transport system substrate-binding protein